MPQGLWIEALHYSAATAAKLSGVHQVDVTALHDAIVRRPGLVYMWDDDPERGRRAILRLRLGKRNLQVVLYPTAEPDVFNLGSCYPVR